MEESDDVVDDGVEETSRPKPTAAEVHACQFSSWYASFRNMKLTPKDNTTTQSTTDDTTNEEFELHAQPTKKLRKNVTIESIIIRPLPSDFIEYLLSDGVRLPDCATKVSSCMKDNNNDDGRWDSGDDDEGNNSQSSTEELKKYSFPSLTAEIQSALSVLGGTVNKGCMPKLNWSSPKDATWMNCGSLKCTKVGDVYLLLKSSEFVSFDLESAWEDLAVESEDETSHDTKKNGMNNLAMHDRNNASNTNRIPHDFQYELVLRKWCNLHPSMEFRCYVYDHELVGISQRHPSKYYPYLQPPSDETSHPIVNIIQQFFDIYVRNRFAQGAVHRYVIDLYVDSQERTWIIDVNVWGSRTDALLFDWKELAELGDSVSSIKRATTKQTGIESSIPMAEMRVVTKDMKSITYDPLSSFRGPTDVMDFMNVSISGTDGSLDGIASFQEFMQQCVRPSEM